MCVSLYLLYSSEKNYSKKLIFDFASTITNPIASVISSTISYVENSGKSIGETWLAKKENIALKLENAKLNDLLKEASRIKSENISLKNQLRFKESGKHKIVLTGRLINIYSNMYSRGGILNLGGGDGVIQNQVLISEGSIVGKISYVGNYYSKITFVSDVNSRIPIITSISGEKAILSGGGNGTAKLLYASDKHKIKAGEIILSSGDGKYYPYGIPIARVTRVQKNQIFATPLISLANIRFVSLLEAR
jgi:rod shape-determining protein MreC